MLDVANKIDSAFQFGFSIFRLGLFISNQVIEISVDPLINPQTETGSKNTSVLMSLDMSLSDLLTHSV